MVFVYILINDTRMYDTRRGHVANTEKHETYFYVHMTLFYEHK